MEKQAPDVINGRDISETFYQRTLRVDDVLLNNIPFHKLDVFHFEVLIYDPKQVYVFSTTSAVENNWKPNPVRFYKQVDLLMDAVLSFEKLSITPGINNKLISYSSELDNNSIASS